MGVGQGPCQRINDPLTGATKITGRGREVLARHPDHIDNTVLAQFPEFQEFLSRAKTTASPPGEGGGGLAEPQTTPEEAIDAAQRELRAALAEEVLGRVLNKPAEFFETVVLDVLLDDSPEAYWRFAEEYYELASMDLAAVREIYALRPLTQPLVTALNGQLSVADLADDIAEIGYRTAQP